MPDQFGRKASLIVSTNAGDGLDLSALRFRFHISAADDETPNTCDVRVYNLTTENARRIRGEFQRVTIQAGYENGNFAVIFDGTIKQVRRGRESAIDSYVDIFGADGDIAYILGVANQSLAAGANSAKQQADALTKGVGLSLKADSDFPGAVLPRGKVLFGMFRDYMRDIAATNLHSWSVQNGQVVVTPLEGYAPGEAVVLTSQTGMIGVPQATDNGISVRALLNPKIQVGTLVKLDNASINTVGVKEQGFPSYNALTFPAALSDDGTYKVLVHEFVGDTRGQEWYSELVCLAVDLSSPAGDSVKLFG